MNRLMTMTVVRGHGECEAVVNGVVNAEIKRLQREAQAQFDAERSALQTELVRAEVIEESRNRMLAAKLDELRERLSKKRQSKIVDAYEVSVATVICFIDRILGRDY